MQKRILVVEDNASNAKLVRLMLQAKGYTVDVAADATEAVIKVAQSRPHLIVMDIQLPDFDGLELTRRLRANASTADIPIVVVSAWASPADERNAEAAGCAAFVAKPIDTRSFPSLVESYLER